MPYLKGSLLIALAVALPAAAAAQSNDRLPAAGQYGISFSIPDGGGAGFGVRKMLSSTVNGGLELQFTLAHGTAEQLVGDDVSSTAWSVGLNPDVRLYHPVGAPVVPFVALDGLVRYSHTESTRDFGVGGGVGIGAEWFPARSVSVSGSTGALLTYAHHTNDLDLGANTLTLNLVRTELTLNLYF